MKKAVFRLLPLALLGVLAVAGSALFSQSASSNSPVGNKILAHKLAVELGTQKARGKEMPVSSGVMYTLYDSTGVLARRAAQNPGAMRAFHHGHGAISRPDTEGCQNVFHGHGQTNTRVNQDCSFRRQAEEMIQINPLRREQHHRRPERLADRLQPLRVRLVVRRWQELGRPGSALLPVRPARQPHGGRLQRSDRGVGLPRQRVHRRRAVRRRSGANSVLVDEVERRERRSLLPLAGSDGRLPGVPRQPARRRRERRRRRSSPTTRS